MNIVFCHGVMDPDENWDTRESTPIKGWVYWMQFQAEKLYDVIMQIPMFPHAHALLMKYDEWEKIMDTQDINADTVLIGHSAGGGFVLKYLSKHPELNVKQVVLVAPWIDVESIQPFNFYKDFKLGNDIMNQTKNGIDLLISDDDDNDILTSVDTITKIIPDIKVHKFTGRGHFISNTLPEIMSIITF